METSSGFKRNFIATYYKQGQQFMYIIGGINTLNHQMVNWCQKYDILNMKYVAMPDMINPRFAPGIYKSKDNFLYAFGGQ